MFPLGIVTNGEQEILAKPGDRGKFDEANFKEEEVVKMIKDAKVTRRMQERYWNEIFELEEEDSEGERDEREPDDERRAGKGNEDDDDEESDGDDGDDGDDGAEEDDQEPTTGESAEVNDDRRDPKPERDEL